LIPCAIAGAGKLPAATTAAVAPSNTSRRRRLIMFSPCPPVARLFGGEF
jgi:hypothetical protein